MARQRAARALLLAAAAAALLAAAAPGAEAALGQRVVCYVVDWAIVSESGAAMGGFGAWRLAAPTPPNPQRWPVAVQIVPPLPSPGSWLLRRCS